MDLRDFNHERKRENLFNLCNLCSKALCLCAFNINFLEQIFWSSSEIFCKAKEERKLQSDNFQ